jgi:glycosyltransferase involved in cell wall biosynthesis
MPDGRPALLVVSPDVGLDTIAGERLRKLTAAFDDEGWRLIGITPPARDYLSSHARWPDSFVVHRTFALDPWTLGVRLKRRRSGGTVTPTPHGAEPQQLAPTGGVESRAKAALHRVWPYPWAGWVPFAVARGIAVARRERPVAVLSSFPPTASHVAALALHRATGVPWIADFRDPWTWRDRHGYNWSADRRGAAATERAVLRHASALTTIGPSLGAELAEHAGREVVVLPHGIPVEPVDAAPRRNGFERLELVHAGTANEPFANLTPVVRALLRLHEQGMAARLMLFGPVEYRPPELDRAEALGLVEAKGNVSREDAQRAAAASDVALLVRKHPSTIWVTTKLWDYLAARTPILVVANPECDAAKLVRETGSGWTVPYDDDAVFAALAEAYERRRAGEPLWTPDEEALARYDAKEISRRFLELLRAQR